MSELTEQDLVQLVRHFYPAGSFEPADSSTQEAPSYTRTPEHQRWLGAWKRAMEWPRWDSLLQELDLTLDGVGDVTQPYMAACRRCSKSIRRPPENGAQPLTRMVAAVSVLAPLYVSYCVTQSAPPRGGSAGQNLSFEPPQEVESQANTLRRSIERVLGYRPFPLPLSNIRVPDVFVPHLGGEPATLLTALFDAPLDNLP
ncbi:hypothetical protein [Hyalangium gracile]|uniref:hypothetical protein n=1 Tax=Hyalangium gracile TaxID=394092 RepID=UPI001CCCD112|nr:hypothetical protein [Hyalangium gracile]